MTKLFRGGGHQPDIEALSAQIDGRLDAARVPEMNEHVADCDACRAVLAEMTQVRATLGSMPEVAAPRSFRLRPADVEPVRKPAAAGWTLSRWAPAIGGLAAVLFFVVLGADLATQDGGDDGSSAVQSSRELTGMIAEGDAGSPAAAGAAPQPDSSGGAITPPDTGTAIPDAGEAFDESASTQAAPVDGTESSSSPAASTGAPDTATTTSPETPATTSDETPAGALLGASGPTTTTANGLERGAPNNVTPISPADTAGPTGAPPSGDSAVPDNGTDVPTALASAVETPLDASTPDQPAAAPAARSAATAPVGVVPPPGAQPAVTAPAQSREEAITAATATPELLALATDDDGEDGNRNWLLIVEIATAMVAVAAGAYLLARRFAGRGAT